MIIEALLEMIFGALKLIFNLLPNLPPWGFFDTVTTFINDIVSKGIGLLCFFIRPNTLLTGLTIFGLIIAFKFSYGFVIWILKKIPFLGVK